MAKAQVKDLLGLLLFGQNYKEISLCLVYSARLSFLSSHLQACLISLIS